VTRNSWKTQLELRGFVIGRGRREELLGPARILVVELRPDGVIRGRVWAGMEVSLSRAGGAVLLSCLSRRASLAAELMSMLMDLGGK